MRLAAVALWVVFAGVTIAGGAQFLLACGGALGLLTLNACPVRPDLSAVAQEIDRYEALRRKVHAEEMRLVALAPCPKPTIDAGLQRKMNRIYKQGAKAGMLEVFLTWNTYDDLDLVVFCPGAGSIGGAVNKRNCGDGEIDKDANGDLVHNVSSTPSEHAVWKLDIPTGEYVFGAYVYKVDKPGAPKSIPFTMVFKLGDEARECKGEVRYYPKRLGRLTQSGDALLGRDLFIVWNSGSPLPECEWGVHEASECGDHVCQER